MSNINTLRESNFGHNIVGPKMLLIAVISQACEDILAMRRAGVVDGLTPLPEMCEGTNFHAAFVIETCEFFGRPLETILQAAGFSISAARLRKGILDTPDDSKLFQIQSLRAERSNKHEKKCTNGEMTAGLNMYLYGTENAKKFGMREIIANSMKARNQQKKYESTENQ